MGLRDRLVAVRDYLLASLVPAPDHPGRGGMTGERASESNPEADTNPNRASEQTDET